MTYRWKSDLTDADVTPQSVFLNRRQVVSGLMGLGAGAGLLPHGAHAEAALEPNSLEDITTYNNFYEFGMRKTDPSRNAQALQTDPWTITVDGLVDNPGRYDLGELMQGLTVEERIYRFRCVEAWSMVVPWNGVMLADVLTRLGVQSGARYVAFETAVEPEIMPGVQSRVIPFPYVEG